MLFFTGHAALLIGVSLVLTASLPPPRTHPKQLMFKEKIEEYVHSLFDGKKPSAVHPQRTGDEKSNTKQVRGDELV